MRYAPLLASPSSDYHSFVAEHLRFNLRFRSKCQRFGEHSSLAEQLEEKLLEKQRLLLQLREDYFRQLQSLKQLNNQLVSTNKQLELQLFSLKLELEKEKTRSLMFSRQIQRVEQSKASSLQSAFKLLRSSLDRLQSQQCSQDQWDGPTIERELSLLEEQLSKMNTEKLDTLQQDFLDSRNSCNRLKQYPYDNQKSLQGSFYQELSLSHD